MQHYVMKFVSDLREIGGFLQVSFTNEIDHHDITEMLLKVVLNTLKWQQKFNWADKFY